MPEPGVGEDLTVDGLTVLMVSNLTGLAVHGHLRPPNGFQLEKRGCNDGIRVDRCILSILLP